MISVRVLAAGVAACTIGCGGGNNNPGDDVGTDATPDSPAGCPRTPAAADRARHVVVAHPYDASGAKADTFEVLDLSDTGTLSRPGHTFTLGRATTGTIAFTPDGEIGLVALEDGSLGVFQLAADGNATPIQAFAGSFYATRVVVDPRGDRAYVIDGNTRDNGGGIYLVTLGCDGTPADAGMIAAAKLPGGLAFAGDRAVIAAADFLDSPAGQDVHVGALDPAARTISADAFPDDMQIIGGTAVTADGTIFLVGDVSQFSGIANRVAIVGLGDTTLTPQGTIDVEDPESIVASPFGDVAVVASAFGDALFVLDTGGANGAWRVRGEVAYQGGSPMLPGDLAMIDRGTLAGRVLVSENVSVRQLAFHVDGTVEDLGSLAFGSGLDNIGGAIGVTP